ncbi:MAG: DICT sensory domain-containing protein [Jaaginema sp. PMC 1079.18]|nr:DICT sensory domain-containing protein [Jaaginema sp. PMC 1079.18]
MSISTSVLTELLNALPQWRSQMYFKSSLTALSHAMEDRILTGTDTPLAIASFQRERFYRQEAHRYRRIAQQSSHVYVLAAPETDFTNQSGEYETIAFKPTDALAQEWHLVIISAQYTNCLICRERINPTPKALARDIDNNRRFEGIWTFDREVALTAADILLKRIATYRPELTEKTEQARRHFLKPPTSKSRRPKTAVATEVNPDPFVQRLVTYLQASQYKLLKAYRSIAAQEQRERLIHLMTIAIRQSLDPEEILEVAVEKLGQVLGASRCLVYCCQEDDSIATINHEFLDAEVQAACGQIWPLADNTLFQEVLNQHESIWIVDTATDKRITQSPKAAILQDLIQRFEITSWLLVPIFYKNELQGMVELHHCGLIQENWTQKEVSLVEAIATQMGVALIQAESYANLEDLNQQLEALDRTRSNLVAITGHELRTPLSTIQICLESLASEPDMPEELRDVMLSTALEDAERMRKLIQDFLTLSQLESGRVEWNPETLSLQECITLALSNTIARHGPENVPEIIAPIASDLPLVYADGEWLVEVLAKLLDNACKFTPLEGQIRIEAFARDNNQVEAVVWDNGRGIEPKRLGNVFDRFYQEEGALQRTTGGTGLGLAICRQIIQRWQGEIWAESAGKKQGSQVHFIVSPAGGKNAKMRFVERLARPSGGEKNKKHRQNDG